MPTIDPETLRLIRRRLSADAYDQRRAIVPYDLGSDDLLYASIVDYLAAMGVGVLDLLSDLAAYAYEGPEESMREAVKKRVVQQRRDARKADMARWKADGDALRDKWNADGCAPKEEPRDS